MARSGSIVVDGMHIAGERVSLVRDPSGGSYVRYNVDWKPDSQGHWFVPAALSGSDYSGGFVNRANFEWFEDTYGEDIGEFFYFTDGAHGTYGVVLYIDDTPSAVWDALARAEQHPVIDEARLTELEEESKDEAWINWVSLQFQGELASHFVRRGMTAEQAADLADEIDEAGDLRNVFYICRDKANVEWQPDGESQSMTIDVGRVAEGCAFLTLEELQSGRLSPEHEQRRGREFLERHVEQLAAGRPEAEPAREQSVEQLAETPAGELTEAEVARVQRHFGYPEQPPPRYDPRLPPAAQRPRFDWGAMTAEQRDYWRSLGYQPPTEQQLQRRIAEHRRRGLIEGLHYNPGGLPGGRAEGLGPEDFDPVELRRGMRHELEHTPDRRIAQEIAMDHLAEDPMYYRKLEGAGL